MLRGFLIRKRPVVSLVVRNRAGREVLGRNPDSLSELFSSNVTHS